MVLTSNTSILSTVIATFWLISLVTSYALEGQWQLTNHNINYTSTPTVRFRFTNLIATVAQMPAMDTLGGRSTDIIHKGTSQLTVYACQTLTFNYYVNESRIYMQEIRKEGSNQSCLANQIQQLEWKINSTFNFVIDSNQLTLLNAYQQPNLRLIRVDPSVISIPQGQYEAWNIQNINGNALNGSQQQAVFFGNNTISVCNFKGELGYIQSQKNNINTKLVNNNCSNQNIAQGFEDTAFYLVNGRMMELYDQNLNKLGTLSFDKSIGDVQYQQLKNQSTPPVTNNQNTNQNNQNITLNETAVTPNETQGQQNQNQEQTTTTTPETNQTATPTYNQTQPPTANQTENIQNQTQGNASSQGQASNNLGQGQTANSQSQGHKSGGSFFLPYQQSAKTCRCNPISGIDTLTPFDPALLYNKWYPYAVNGTDLNVERLYYYFLIITPVRMTYYGGCEVRWSPYKLNKNTLSNINTGVFPKSSSSCRQNNLDNEVLQPFFNTIKYVDFARTQDIPYLLFYDQNLKHIATFNTEYPTFPPIQQ